MKSWQWRIPGRDDQLLPLGTRVPVQEMRKNQEEHTPRNPPVLLPLPQRRPQRQQEQDIPRDPHLEKHLEIQPLQNPWIQLRAHEEIIHMVPRQFIRRATDMRRHVKRKRQYKPRRNRNAKQRPKLIEQSIQLENAGKMQPQRRDQRDVPRPHRGAVIRQLSTVQVRDALPFAVHPGQVQVSQALENEERPVYRPRSSMRERVLADLRAEMEEERRHALVCGWQWEFPVVECRPDPHVVHEQREAHHHRADAPCAAEFALGGGFGGRIVGLLFAERSGCCGLLLAKVNGSVQYERQYESLGVCVCEKESGGSFLPLSP